MNHRSIETIIQRLRDQAQSSDHVWTTVMRLLLEAADALEEIDGATEYREVIGAARYILNPISKDADVSDQAVVLARWILGSEEWSDTPRTDAISNKWSRNGGNRNGCDASPEAMELYEHARQLERELREATTQYSASRQVDTQSSQ